MSLFFDRNYSLKTNTERNNRRYDALVWLVINYPERQSVEALSRGDTETIQHTLEDCHRNGFLCPSMEFTWGDGTPSGKFLHKISHKGLAYIQRDINHYRFLDQNKLNR